MPSVADILGAFKLDRSIWRFRSHDPRDGGFICGRIDASGYRRINISSVDWAEHRLIWKVVTGEDPQGVIDHINGIRDDNRFENLRDVPPSVNAMNHHGDLWERTIAVRQAQRREQRAAERMQRAARVEEKERALLAKLKAKYET